MLGPSTTPWTEFWPRRVGQQNIHTVIPPPKKTWNTNHTTKKAPRKTLNFAKLSTHQPKTRKSFVHFDNTIGKTARNTTKRCTKMRKSHHKKCTNTITRHTTKKNTKQKRHHNKPNEQPCCEIYTKLTVILVVFLCTILWSLLQLRGKIPQAKSRTQQSFWAIAISGVFFCIYMKMWNFFGLP